MRDDRPERDGLFEALDEFLDALRRAAEEGTAGDAGTFGDRVRVDYDYDVRTGLGPASPGRKGHPRFWGSGRPTGDDAVGTGGPVEPGARPTHVAIEDDHRVVTVDVSDAGVDSAGAVSVTADDGTVTVAHDGETLARVPLSEGPWTVADVRLHNGVLEAEVVPA